MPEIDLVEAKAVRDKLETEVKESNKIDESKENIIEVLNAVLSIPNLKKEISTLEKAINKNRKTLQDMEDAVIREREIAKKRIAEINAEILAAEKELDTFKKGDKEQRETIAKSTNKFIEMENNRGQAASESINANIGKLEQKQASIISETDSLKNELRRFKEQVKNITLDE